MGKPAGRLGDIGSNHGDYPPTPIISGSANVIISGKPAARVGDALAPHKKPRSSTHGRTIAAGANTVLINGKPAANVGAKISCGGMVISGSPNVTIGDSPSPIPPATVALDDFDFPDQWGNTPQKYIPNTAQTKGMTAGTGVTYDFKLSTMKDDEPELKSVIVRIDIDPEYASKFNSKFILSSTDGSYKVTKSVKDDLIPGDGYLDLKYDNLDTSKLFNLEVDHGGEKQLLLSSYVIPVSEV